MRTFAFLLVSLLALPAHAAEVIVDFQDAPGTGFFDTTPIAPPPGSSATTRGAARRIAFQYAASLWGSQLRSRTPIRVRAVMTALPCTTTSGLLGQAGPNSLHIDFPGAPRAATFYPAALANALASEAMGSAVDLDPSSAEIGAEFSSLVDDPNCLGTRSWYYGLTGNAPAGEFDFATIVIHELAHGLGLVPAFSLSTGAEVNGRDDSYEVLLEQHGVGLLSTMSDAQRLSAAASDQNLHWIGGNANAVAVATLDAGILQGHLRMHGPSQIQQGGSVGHVSTALSPNNMFEPFYTGTNRDTRLALGMLRDIGWREATPVPALGGHALLSSCLLAALLFRRTTRGSRSPAP